MISSSFYDVIFDLDNYVISKERLANVTHFVSMRQLLPFSPILFAPDCSSSSGIDFILPNIFMQVMFKNVSHVSFYILISKDFSLCNVCQFSETLY